MIRGEGGAPVDSASVFESILTHTEGIVADVEQLAEIELADLSAEDVEHLRETGDNLARAGLLLTELTNDLVFDGSDDETIEFGSEESYGVALRYLCITRRFELVSAEELVAHLRRAGVDFGDMTPQAIMEEIDDWGDDIRDDARNQLGVSGHVALVDNKYITFGDDGTNLAPPKPAPKKRAQHRLLPSASKAGEQLEEESPNPDEDFEVFRATVGQILEVNPMKASKLVRLLVRESFVRDDEQIRALLNELAAQQVIYKFRNGSTYYTTDPAYEQYMPSRNTAAESSPNRSRERQLDVPLAAEVLGVMTRPATHWQTRYRPDQLYRYIHNQHTRAVPKEEVKRIREVARALQHAGILITQRAKKGTKKGGSGISIKGKRSSSDEVLTVWLASQKAKNEVRHALDTNSLEQYLIDCGAVEVKDTIIE